MGRSESGRRIGQPGFAHRSERGDRVGEGDTADHTHDADDQGPRHDEPYQLARENAEERGRVPKSVGLGRGLPGKRLGRHDHAPPTAASAGQDPPPDGLGMDGGVDGVGLAAVQVVLNRPGRDHAPGPAARAMSAAPRRSRTNSAEKTTAFGSTVTGEAPRW